MQQIPFHEGLTSLRVHIHPIQRGGYALTVSEHDHWSGRRLAQQRYDTLDSIEHVEVVITESLANYDEKNAHSDPEPPSTPS